MEKLIKIQSLIMEIEEITLDSKYRSQFLYKNEETMQVKCFCWEQARTLKDLFGYTNGMVIYMKDNSTIEFHVWKTEKEV